MTTSRRSLRRRPPAVRATLLSVMSCLVVCGCTPGAMGRDANAATVIEIRSRLSSGEGSIRAAIEAANVATRPTRIVSRLAPGTVVYVFRELPAVAGRNVTLEGAGLVLRGDDCVRLDGRPGCSGLVVTGENVAVNDLAATGFLFDGISVRGARDVSIRGGRFFANSDDGIGISEAASGVVVESCLLEGNGFRSKGKGVLIFDRSRAVLRDNRIVGNRDGVTVSKRSHAVLERNDILDSYDKGFGVAGATAEGTGNRIVGSGSGRSPLGAAPNADGVRVTIDSTVTLTDSTISGSGDVAVFASGRSRVDLLRATLADNGGGEARVADEAVIVINGRELRGKPTVSAEPKPVEPAPVKRGRTRSSPPHRR